MEGQCRKQAPNARPVLPTSDRENELIVKMMNNTKGVWIHAKRDGKLIKGMKSSSRLKYNRMSAQTRRLISRPRNNFGRYVFVKKNAEWYFFKDSVENKLRRGVICQDTSMS